MTPGDNNPLPPLHRLSTASLSGSQGVSIATLILRYFFRYFSSTSTEQISPDSAGPFIVSILLALLFSLFSEIPSPHSRASTPRASGAGRSDENDPSRKWSVHRSSRDNVDFCG